MSVTVECQERPTGLNPRALRREGLIPAALYGHKGTESISLAVEAKAAETLLKQASVNNTLVDVKIPHLSWNGKALLREVQSHPWRRNIYHLSFFAVAAQDSLSVTVPVNLVGEAPGVKEGGVIDQIITELQVDCAPDSIPESIEVDVSKLEIGSTLHISDLSIPAGVSVSEDPGRTVVSLVAPRSITAEEESEVSPEVAEVLAAMGGEEESAAEGEAPVEE